MMAFTNHLGRTKTNFKTKILLTISQKETTPHQKDSKDKLSTPKSPTKTSSQKGFKYLGFGHIVDNCPSKRTMMVKGG